MNSQPGSESSSLNHGRVLSEGCRGDGEGEERDGETHNVRELGGDRLSKGKRRDGEDGG